MEETFEKEGYKSRIHSYSISLIERELDRAFMKHGEKPFNSDHEGYAVLLEEVDEYWDEVKNGYKRSGKDRGLWNLKKRNEAVQIAAMAIRIIQELNK